MGSSKKKIKAGCKGECTRSKLHLFVCCFFPRGERRPMPVRRIRPLSFYMNQGVIFTASHRVEARRVDIEGTSTEACLRFVLLLLPSGVYCPFSLPLSLVHVTAVSGEPQVCIRISYVLLVFNVFFFLKFPPTMNISQFSLTHQIKK
eukprot:gene11738-8076_t